MIRRNSVQAVLQYGGLLGVLALLVIVFSLQSRNFFQHSTAVSIANQIPDLMFVAVGMTLILITAGIDLSVGSVMALSAAVSGVLMGRYGWPLWMAVPVCLVTGGLCGVFNGVVSVGFGIPSFIVTLGMLEIARGATKVVTASQTIYLGRSVEWFGEPLAGWSLSPAFLLACGVVLTGEVLLTRTVFGRYIIAIGANREAARMAGIRTAPYSVAVFVISGVLCGIAGLAQTSRLSSADPNAATGMELAAIAACVIGGTSLMGGRGSVIASFIGVVIIAVLQTGLAQLGVSDANKQIVTGSVIIVAVLIDAFRSRWSQRRESHPEP